MEVVTDTQVYDVLQDLGRFCSYSREGLDLVFPKSVIKLLLSSTGQFLSLNAYVSA